MEQRERVRQWWEALKTGSNQTFWPLFLDEQRYLILCGGGGSGKSIFAGRKVLERCLAEPGHRFLVCRKVARTLRESCYRQLLGQLAEHYSHVRYRTNKTDLTIRFPNGSSILFAGLDDVEKLKSIYDITGIWIEEASELEEGDFNQLDIRLRTLSPYYLQIIASFNPVSITHWLKKRFFDRSDPRATTHRSTYRDNRFLPAEAIATLESFAETDPYYYQVYALGQWGVSGKTIFNAAAITRRLERLPGALRRGCFDCRLASDGLRIEDWSFMEEPGGVVAIYAEPEPGRPYVIGGDTAGEGSDWFVAQVLDNISGRQVAVLRCQYDEDSFARQVYCLGQMYHTALIGLETNFSTYPTKLLGLMNYPRLYVREVEDSFGGTLRQSFGFATTAVTRPVILAELVRVLRNGAELLSDEVTLQELLSFVRNGRLRAEAEPGAHDDCVMALAIAHYIRPQQAMQPAAECPETRVWTEDQWEDYDAASPKERKLLISRWGMPKGRTR